MTLEQAMAQGIRNDLPTGWKHLVRCLLSNLNLAIEDNQIQVLQIKEKFGGLRFYYQLNSVTPGQVARVHAMVSATESASHKTCMICGSEGVGVSIGGWRDTLCEDCELAKRTLLLSGKAYLKVL